MLALQPPFFGGEEDPPLTLSVLEILAIELGRSNRLRSAEIDARIIEDLATLGDEVIEPAEDILSRSAYVPYEEEVETPLRATQRAVLEAVCARGRELPGDR